MSHGPYREHLAGVPALVVHPDAAAAAAGPPPVALWFHGYRAAADANVPELQRIADAGFVAVGVDAVGHGPRRAADLDAREAAAPGGALDVMLDLAARTVGELPAVLEVVAARGWGDPSRVSMVGVSMGGYLAYRAGLRVADVRAVVALLGSPEWPGDDSPHRRPAAWHGIALLSITAEQDVNVPPDAARRFHAALAEGHPEPSRARYVEIAGAPHLMNGAQWEAGMREMLAWLETFGR